MKPGVEHFIIVPSRDIKLFDNLAGVRRQVVAVEDVVAQTYWQLPLSDRWWLNNKAFPVRGWIMQQITKLSADRVTDAELILFADSDLQFIRDFDMSQIYQGDKLRLHRVPGAMDTGVHLKWHHRAATLLGLTPRYFGSDYVGQLITWRRSHLQSLHEHMEQIGKTPWQDQVAHSLRFSEYILYGVYVEHVLGEHDTSHFSHAQDLAQCCWFSEEVQALCKGEVRLAPNAMALLLQSNLNLSTKKELEILHAVRAQGVLN